MSAHAALPALDVGRVESILSRYREPVLAEMRAALDRPGVEHLGLMRYHLGWEDRDGAAVASGGGKMLRPALCLLACEAVGGDVARAMPAAAAIELVHNFTLVHDDIEDASDTRHGRETLWRVRGVPQAINAGDGMFVLAQRTLLRMADTGVDAERVVAAATVLNEACVALCEGQHADIGFETRDAVSLAEYEAMIAGKTASLIAASMAIGAIAGGADGATVSALEECGRRLGMAFQVQDDVLGVWGDAAQTGKPVADDIRSRKKSFPVVCAREQLDASGRAELERLFASESMTDDVVESALALFERANARQAATAAAAEWAASAVEEVRGVSLEEERRGDLAALASFFVYRTA